MNGPIRGFLNSILALSLVWGIAAKAASPPKPTAAEAQKLSQVAAASSAGVLLVGHPDRGQGTAFVLSRKYGLAATAAHVADLFRGPGTMFAVVNGSNATYRVTRVWYHPGLRRNLDDGLTVRSPDPDDGSVAVPGPDVAVLQLEGGPPLPFEWPLAGPEVGNTLPAKPVALLGYPGYADWPIPGRPAVATLHLGIVQVEDTYAFEDGGHPSRRQLLEHSAATPEGSSGSPVFLGDGRVLGVHNILKIEDLGLVNESGMSVRIDALWELLVYHKLDRFLPANDPRWDVMVPDEPPVDPRRADLQRAVKLVREAADLVARDDHRGAGALCAKALKLAPEYAGAYIQRSRAYTDYCGRHWDALSPEVRRQQAEWAIEDAKAGFFLGIDKLDGLCLLLQNSLFLGLLDRDREAFEGTIQGAEEVLSRKYLDPRHRSFLINCRAQARHYLGDWDGALRDYTESIRLSPREPSWYLNRAHYWDQRNRPDLAENDRRVARMLTGR